VSEITQKFLNWLSEHKNVPVEIEIDGAAKAAFVFDWSDDDPEVQETVQDVFCDSDEGIFSSYGGQLVPFALLGVSSVDDDEGQVEDILLFRDDTGEVIHIEVDGTAIEDTLQTLCGSVADIAIAKP
jgi:hypothetical protein